MASTHTHVDTHTKRGTRMSESLPENRVVAGVIALNRVV
jgi:hypothetical protein